MRKPRTAKTETAGRSQQTKRTRVLIVGEHKLFRSGLHALLQPMNELEVRESAHEEPILASIEHFKPDVIVLDMTSLRGFVLFDQVAQGFPAERVVGLIEPEEAQYAIKTLELGVAGLNAKTAGSAELKMAIKSAVSGQSYVSESLKQAVTNYSQNARGASHLTPRQDEVLKLVAEGLTTKEIARRLRISAKTVETHRAHIMERLNIRDIANLVRYALRIGLVKFDP